MIEKKCLVCGIIFRTKPSLVRIGKGKLCSVDCSRKHLSLIKQGKPNYSKTKFTKGNIPWNKNKKGLQVSWCKGKKNPQLIGNQNGFRKGLIPWNKGKKFLSGEMNPNWRGGLSRHSYPWNFNEQLKNLIRERDNYKCVICGIPQEECVRKLDIHHKDRDKNNLNPENLITLCRICHLKVSFNKLILVRSSGSTRHASIMTREMRN